MVITVTKKTTRRSPRWNGSHTSPSYCSPPLPSGTEASPMGYPFVPALRFHWLTPVYNPLMSFSLPDIQIKRDLIARLRPESADRILDFSCGTRTLALMVTDQHPSARLRGLDIDSIILAQARRKAVESSFEQKRTALTELERFLNPEGRAFHRRFRSSEESHYLNDCWGSPAPGWQEEHAGERQRPCPKARRRRRIHRRGGSHPLCDPTR